MNEQNNHKPGSAASAISERRRMQKSALIKAGVMLVLGVILFIFSSMHMVTKQMTAETA